MGHICISLYPFTNTAKQNREKSESLSPIFLSLMIWWERRRGREYIIMERSREARRPSMAASNGFLKLRERPSNKRSMREQSTKQRRVRGDQGHESTEEGSVGYSDEQAPQLMVAHEMIGVAVPRKARSGTPIPKCSWLASSMFFSVWCCSFGPCSVF